jgi:hypothetical protein
VKNLSRTDDPRIANIADETNRELNNLSSASFGGQVIEDIILPVGVEVEIPHNLKITPKYRIILKQDNGVYISDGDTAWDDKRIYLKAEGASGSSGAASINWEIDGDWNTPAPQIFDGKIVKRVLRNPVGTNWTIDDSSNWSAIEMPTEANIVFDGGGGATTVTEVRISILILRS